MKKTKYYAWMMAAALAMTGCSDEMEGPGNGPGTTVEGETGYVKIALNLPSTSGSTLRADTDNSGVTFDDGDEYEYDVNDVILALFYGANENTATLQSAYSLTGSWTDIENDENITRYLSNVQSIPMPSENEKVFALVIVNKSGYFNVTSDNKLQYDANGSTPANLGDGTNLASFYSTANTITSVDISKIAKTPTNTGDKGNFLMLNAPISDGPALTTAMPDDHKVTTLVELPVYDSQDDAEAGGATDIYVERAVAKVSVTATATEIDADGTNYDGLAISFSHWALQTANKKMFVIRNVYVIDASTVMPETSPAWKTWDGYYVGTEANRFYGTTPNPYRVYWGVDPNYFSKITDSDGATTNMDANFTVIRPGDSNIKWIDMPTAETPTCAYCAENTTTAETMESENQLTGVLLEATVGDGTNFFMLENELTIYLEDDFLALVTNALNRSETTGVPLTDGQSVALKSGLTKGLEIVQDSEEDGAAKLTDLLEIKTSDSSPSALSADQQSAIFTALGSTIHFYCDGKTYYYTSMIKHFGDNPTTADESSSVDYEEEKHLGRYGVLRNNWYELDITSVTGIGDVDIPDVPVTPPDQTQRFINARINILSWARRAQSVEL